MDIATALSNGTVEFLADGTQLSRPPTALAARAATHIRNLEGQHQIHLQALMQAQQRESVLLEDAEMYRQKLKELDADLQNLRKSESITSDTPVTEAPTT